MWKKIKHFNKINTDEKYNEVLHKWRADVNIGVRKKTKTPDFDNYSLCNELFVDEYIQGRLQVAEGIEAELLLMMQGELNEEQEYNERFQMDDNEKLFLEPLKFNPASTSDMSNLFRFTFMANAISEKFIGKKPKVLDIGCSKGNFYSFWKSFQPAKKPTLDYTGLDVRKECIDYCSEKYPKMTWLNEDIMYDFPIEQNDQKYDVIIFTEVIEHIPKADALNMMGIIYDLLEPDGLLLLSSPSPKKEIGQMLTNPEAHAFEYSETEIRQIIHDFGFKVLDYTGFFGRGAYISMNLTPSEKEIWDKAGRYSGGIRIALMNILRPDLAEGYVFCLSKK